MAASPDDLSRFIADAGTVTVLSGAGVSTASGIPDYRDRDGNWKHARPVQYRDFISQAPVRRRYWARSFAGWRRIGDARPNAAHRSLATLEEGGYVDTIVTQNVDGLHGRAGSRRVIDLHGRLDRVTCLDCGAGGARERWQQRLAAANPGWDGAVAEWRPDGDVEFAAADVEAFRVPGCEVCGGLVKPDVVFFGESVPPGRVADATAAVSRAGGLLVVGSSLMVYSGLRFVRQAAALGKPVAILNQGVTRADDEVCIKVDADCGSTLAAMIAALPGDRAAGRPTA